MRRLALTMIASAGCVASAAPRFPDDVASALVEHDMRRLETDTLVIYYPSTRRELAVRAAEKIARCQLAVQGLITTHGWTTKIKPVIVMPELPMNNAFVMPRTQGYEDVAVLPTHATLDFATAFGLPPDTGAIGCHEIVHYVHAQQIGGVWAALDRVFGDVLTPQAGIDAWFWEGLATYYEGQLQPGMGRLAWPAWRGVFAAAYAGGELDGSDLSEAKRLAPMGHHYLVGSHFIEWLADTYGADQLWQVIGLQASAVSVPLDVNGRFKAVYGASLSAMIDRFAAHLARDLPRRNVPAGQRVLRAVGSDARYARARDGTEALVHEDLDAPTRLEVRAPDGTVVFDEPMIDLVPPRQLVMAAPLFISGMSFTADARALYLTAIDQGATYQIPRLLRLDVATGALDEVKSGLGPGGAVAPDGGVYWYAQVDGDAWGLGEYDLATGARRTILAPQPGQYVLKVAPSPSGDQLALSKWDGTQFSIAIVDRQGHGLGTIALGPGFPVYDASFLDEDRVIYLAGVNGRFQVMMEELATGARVQITDAPYTALEPRAANGTVRFLDREAWRWDLDEVVIPQAPIPEIAKAPPRPADPYAAPAPVDILSDHGYAMFDGFFRPQLHAFAIATPAAGALLLGAGFAGGDRLGRQRWAVTGYVNPTPKPVLFSWAAAYSNAMLAPVGLSLAAQELRWHHPWDTDVDAPGFETFQDRRQLDVVGSLGRVIRGTTRVSIDAIYTRDAFEESVAAGEPRVWRRLGGAGFSLAQDNLEATPYGGARRRLAGALTGVYYPRRFSSFDADLIDARAELVLTVPVPFTRRHRIDLDLVGRAGEPRGGDDTPSLLQIGGTGAITPFYQRTRPSEDPPLIDDAAFPDHVRFLEPLRGFEDYTMPARRAALATARWRYPLIADYGWATSLYYFPAILIREVDLELFGAGGLLDDGAGWDAHLSGGAALTLSTYFWHVPLLVQYQVSRRFTDDEATSHLVGVGVGL